MNASVYTTAHAQRPDLPQVPRLDHPHGQDRNDNPALIPMAMPPLVARLLSGILVFSFLVGTVIAACVDFPDTIKASFTVAPDEGTDPLKAPRRGTLESVRVRESDTIRPHEVLFTIRTEELTRVPRLEEELRVMADMDVILEKRHVQAVEAAKQKAASFMREYYLAHGRSQTAAKVYEAAGTRAVSRLGTRNEADSARLSYDGAKRDAEAARRGSEDARVAILELEAQRRQEISERAIQRNQKLAELEELKALVETQPADANGGGHGATSQPLLVTVRAPFSGSVVDLRVKQPGTIVERGEVLAQLAKEGAKLRVTVELPNDAAGRVSLGQESRLLFGSFPYARYGVRTGKLTWVSEVGEKGTFRAFADLDQTFFEKNGKRYELRPGMQGEARIIVGAHTLLEMAFESLKRLREDWRGGR